MFISCPKCSTSYTIDGRDIDISGRGVRCFKCGEAWHQYPEPVERAQNSEPRLKVPKPETELKQEIAEVPSSNPQYYGPGYPPPNMDPSSVNSPPPFYPPPPNTDPGAGPYYPPPYPPPYPPYYPPYYPPPPQAPHTGVDVAAPNPTDAEPTAAAAPEQSQSASQPGASSDPSSASDNPPLATTDNETTPTTQETPDEDNLPSEEALAEALGEEDDVEAIESATPQPKEDLPELSEEDLENLEDPEPIGGAGGQEKVELEDPDMDPEDLPDPDPLPAGAGESDTVEKKRSFKGIIISLIILILLGGIIAGLIVMRHTVASVWPGANGVLYDLIGLRVPQPGDGLELSLRSPQRKTEGGKDVIIFEVIIQNTTDQTQRVPTVISSLTDAEGNQVQEIKTEPSKPTLEAGKILKFTAKFPNAPAAAKESIAKWGDYPKTGSEDQKK
mgnify:FL=1